MQFRPAHIFALAILASTPALADPYWIFLKDKGSFTDASLQQALAVAQSSLAPETLTRRELRGTNNALVSISDLPVNASYVSSITNTGVTLRTESNWLNAVSVNASASQLAALSALPFVDHVQPVLGHAIPQITNDAPVAPAANNLNIPTGFYGYAYEQITAIHLDQAHNAGYTGAGVTIGVLDTGFKRTHDIFNQPGHVINVIAEHDFINNTNDTSSTVNNQHVHGTYILGQLAGYQPNFFVGGAYNAKFLLAKTEVVPTETQVEEDYWVAGLQWLESNGADVVSSSLGYVDWYSAMQLNGHTAVTTLAANIATANGLPIVNAAGNQYHDADPNNGSLLAPGDARLVITVGAAHMNGDIVDFSSDGNLGLLGALKPEVLAPGTLVVSPAPDFHDFFTYTSGTSLATPLVASAVALLIEAHPDWTVEDIRYALMSTASNWNNPDYAENVRGYGMINAYAALYAQVPEPASLSLLFAGSMLLLARRRIT